jgi:hypothetical protein
MSKYPNIIYGLVCPITLLIHYIGLSSQGMKRPREHRRKTCPNSHCGRWIRTLRRKGLDYYIAILEEVSDPSMLAESERWWIAYGKCCGWPLTNQTNGGELYLSEEVKLRRFKKRVCGYEREEQALNYYKLMYEKHERSGADTGIVIEMARCRLATAGRAL